MEVAPLVAAFSDSPRLRETLRVLFQHDCELRFLSTDTPLPADVPAPDLAVIAMHGPTPLLRSLQRRWPRLPIVTVDVTDGTDALGADVPTVPLEPHAIRAAVLQRLGGDGRTALRSALQRIGESLRCELAHAFAALRSGPALHAAHPGPDTKALLAAVMHEQSQVMDDWLQCVERFQSRPRSTDLSPHFGVTLCRQLEHPDAGDAERGTLYVCTIDMGVPHPRGPMTLVPTAAALLHTHVARRHATSVANVRVSADGLTVSYSAVHPRPPRTTSWPLLLLSLALQPWGWHVFSTSRHTQDTVTLCPASAAPMPMGDA
jgi:hypothetical protein